MCSGAIVLPPYYFVNFTMKRYSKPSAIFSIIAIILSHVAYSQTDRLSLKYFGTAGWQISHDGFVVLVDPYISRIKLGTGPSISPEDNRQSFSRSDRYIPDSTLIDELIPRADFILVHHSHFDHLSDVPYIARKTGAKVIGTETTINILRAYGIPDDQVYAVRGGEDYQFEKFSVRIIPSIHSALREKHYYDSRKLPEKLTVPLAISDFIEGGSLMFMVRLGGKEILTMGSMNFVEREIQGLTPDVLLAGVNGSRFGIYKYTERLLKATGMPAIVIPTHWDNFRIPYGFSQEPAIEGKLKPFVKEVAEISAETKVILPTHLETIIIDQ